MGLEWPSSLKRPDLGVTEAPACLSPGSRIGSCRVGLLDPQARRAWKGAQEGPVLGLWNCEVPVRWGRLTREGMGSVERWR